MKTVMVDGALVPDIRCSDGRIAYGTKGQHEQCQPRIAPDKLGQARREFFTETLFKKRDREEVVKATDGGIADPLT